MRRELAMQMQADPDGPAGHIERQRIWDALEQEKMSKKGTRSGPGHKFEHLMMARVMQG